VNGRSDLQTSGKENMVAKIVGWPRLPQISGADSVQRVVPKTMDDSYRRVLQHNPAAVVIVEPV
jgi:hypothetical protein